MGTDEDLAGAAHRESLLKAERCLELAALSERNLNSFPEDTFIEEDMDNSLPVNSSGVVSLVVRRRRAGKRYQALLHLGAGTQRGAGSGDHGITLDSGIYISRISPGSVSARESGIAVGDRVLSINEAHLDHVRSVQDATALLNQAQDLLSITLLKNAPSCGPLSSSSR